jgi:hypothetical protein
MGSLGQVQVRRVGYSWWAEGWHMQLGSRYVVPCLLRGFDSFLEILLSSRLASSGLNLVAE